MTSKEKPSPAGAYSSLCRPDQARSCFRCCPPIRPAGYDHLDHRSEMTRILSENTLAFRSGQVSERPITGFSCWGLGFPAPGSPAAGCLLHPEMNQGVDRREATGYADKCRRELCRESRVFETLSPRARNFVLALTEGLDGFEYSSPKANPAFRLLRWGRAVVESLALADPGLDRKEYRAKWKILDQDLDPDQHGYAWERLLSEMSPAEISSRAFQDRYREAFDSFRSNRRAAFAPPLDNRPFVHRLDLPPAFARFMSLVLDRPRARLSEADQIKRDFDDLLAGLSG